MENSLEKLIQWTEQAEESSRHARELSERDRDYYDNKQWTPGEVEELTKRKQPVLTFNAISRKINYLLGIEKQQRTDPKAFPRNPTDEEAANAATDSLRYVATSTDFDSTASKVWKNVLIEGFGGCQVGIDLKNPNDPKITIEHFAWDRLFIDPHSSEGDATDARFKGGYMFMDFEDALAKWPHAKAALETTMSAANGSETYDDKPKEFPWTDGKQNRVRVAQIWYKTDNDWYFCTFTKGGKIAEGRSPYRTQDGESLCGLIIETAYMDRDNNRYGAVRELISPQDEVNKRRSKSLHLLSVRQTKAERGAVEDVPKMKAELAKPDGHIEVLESKNFEILPTGDQLSANLAMLQEAKQQMEFMGPNASMMGKSGKGAESGKAIIAQQQGGFIELGPLLDGHSVFKRQVFEMVWHLIQQYWTKEKWVRVTDDDNKPRFTQLNRPVPIGEIEGYAPEVIKQFPHLQEPTEQRANVVAELDMDILIEEAPDALTIQHEQFQEFVGLASAGVPIPLDLLVSASQLRDKEKILARMNGEGEGQDPAIQEQTQKALAIQIEMAEQELLEKVADVRLKNAKAAEIETDLIAPQN